MSLRPRPEDCSSNGIARAATVEVAGLAAAVTESDAIASTALAELQSRRGNLQPQFSLTEHRRFIDPEHFVASHVPVSPALVYTPSADLFLHYVIALDLARIAPPGFLLLDPVDQRYVHVRDLRLVVHHGAVVSVEYRAYRGRGFRLPRIRLLDTATTVDARRIPAASHFDGNVVAPGHDRA